MLPLTPSARARASVSGTSVVLADGQEWVLANPRPGFRAVLRPDGTIEACMASGLSGEYSGLLDELMKPQDAFVSCSLVYRMAVILLTANYEMTPAEAVSLMPVFENKDDEGPSAYSVLESIVLGVSGPKA